jgi:hypothetical protein
MTGVPEPMGWQVPPLREFVVSSGFAGAAALLAAVIVVCAVLYASRRAAQRGNAELEQRERHHQEARKDEQHAAAVTRCWDRLVWVVETAGIEPAASEGATLGLGPELALELLRGLLRDAEQLGDDTLAQALTVYQNQLALVLAQQGGPLSELAAAGSSSPDGKPDKSRASSAHEKPDAAPASAADETPAGTAEVADAGRRRRR